jgi:very-short-patch-repair endonuclease
MAGKTLQQISKAAWGLARSQHWVITRGQLLDLGFTASAIEHRIAVGRLHPIYRGVYAVGRRQLTREGYWMAAVLACGKGAFLSHRSAATLRGIASFSLLPIHVSVLGGGRRRFRGLVAHRRSEFPPEHVTVESGIAVTSVVWTLVDIARDLTRAELEDAIKEADVADLCDVESLRTKLEDFRGYTGVASLREALDRRTFRLTDTQLERWFLPIARAAGLPEPLTQVWLDGMRVDFYWPELGLVVETDGLRYHRTPAQQAKDQRRDQAHAAAGRVPLRFSHGQVRYERASVREVLESVATRLRDERRNVGGFSPSGRGKSYSLAR